MDGRKLRDRVFDGGIDLPKRGDHECSIAAFRERRNSRQRYVDSIEETLLFFSRRNRRVVSVIGTQHLSWALEPRTAILRFLKSQPFPRNLCVGLPEHRI